MTTRRPATKLVTLEDIEKAGGAFRRYPDDAARAMRPLTAALGGPAWLKCENVQRAGSFKVRGAYMRISRLTKAERARGVVAASAGNHAQGVALADEHARRAVHCVHARWRAAAEGRGTRAYGAKVEFAGATVDESLIAAQEFADRTGAILIHPFNHLDVIAGQGTVGLEIIEQCPDVRTIVTGHRGRWPDLGHRRAAKATNPDLTVIGVQAAGAAAVPSSLKTGSPVRLASFSTIADGIAVGCRASSASRTQWSLVDDVVTVTDEDIARAMVYVAQSGNKLVVEAAGAVGVAALLTGAVKVETPVVAVLSGGNMDPLLMMRVIERGLAAAGRYLRFRVRFAPTGPDNSRPCSH
jgi:threonine dehydratase